MALKDLKLKELRELYPDISARSKDEFLKEVAKAQEVEFEVVKPEIDEPESEMDIVDYLELQAPTKEKILIKCADSNEADNLFAVLQFELFPKLSEKGMSVVASSARRDMSLNGTCYVRVTCVRNYPVHKGLVKYTQFKEV